MFERYPNDWWAEEVIGLYYEQLNDDADFRAALVDLFQRLAEPARRLAELGERTRHYALFHQPYPFQPSNFQWMQGDDFAYWSLHDEIGHALSAFCEHRHLPTRSGLRDVWYSLRLYLIKPEFKPELLMSARVYWQAVAGIPLAIDEIQSGSDRIVVSMKLPYIFPNAPLPFLYDPVEQNRAWLNQQIDAICASVRQSILSQAEVFESQVKAEGWDKRPPRYTGDYLRCVGRALYLRAVKGMKWDDVMRQCDDGLSDQEGFAYRIREWAGRCGIPL